MLRCSVSACVHEREGGEGQGTVDRADGRQETAKDREQSRLQIE
jgi:hypothetical protein